MPTQADIAEHLDLSQKQVSELVAELGIDWRNEAMSVIRTAYIRKLRGAAAGHRSDSGLDLVHERVMSERVDRELKLLNLAEKKGLLVNVAQLEPELEQMVVAFRTEVLSLVDKIKTDLDAVHGIDIDLQLLNGLAHDALSQLARYDPEREGAAAPPSGESGATAKDVDGGMGQGISAPQSEIDGPAGALQP
jgi:hypothetical protein